MVKRVETGNGIVYSTEHGRMCPACNRPLEECVCGRKQTAKPGEGCVRVSLETKGRKGKGVTLIFGVPANLDGLKALASILKQTCGSGGSVKNGVIEIQGDHRDKVLEALKGQGYTAKRAGG